MTNNIIPAAAVEAAAKAAYEKQMEDGDTPWDGYGRSSYLDYWRDQARAALEAAGPHMQRTIPSAHLNQDASWHYPVDFKVGTIIQAADGSVWRFDEGDWGSLGWGSASLRGPAIVLFEPSVG